MTIKKDEDEYRFTILKSHKERFALADKVMIGTSVSIEGIPKLRIIICTRLKILDKGIMEGRQEKIGSYV